MGSRSRGQQGASPLILSQVVLSLQLPFAIVPLVMFTADKRKTARLAALGDSARGGDGVGRHRAEH